MTRSYIITQQAEQDIDDIFTYSKDVWGVERATHYLQDLHEGLCYLADNRALGKPCSALLPAINKPLFYYMWQRHYVVFRREKGRLELLALFHNRVDLPRHLKNIQ